MNDFIIAGLATIKRRSHILKDTVDSIIDQVDVLMIYFNDYSRIPQWLLEYPMGGKINYFGSIDQLLLQGGQHINLGDKGKFYTIPFCNGYYLSLDDDLIYPPDYAERMKTSIDMFDREAIITNHGRIIKEFPIRSYYRDTSAGYHFGRQVEGYHEVHIGGTGVMGFHTDTFKPDINKMFYPNMADVYVADQAQEQAIPIVVQPHSNGWIRQNPATDERKTIFSRNRTNDYHQTKLINRRTSWQLNRITLTS